MTGKCHTSSCLSVAFQKCTSLKCPNLGCMLEEDFWETLYAVGRHHCTVSLQQRSVANWQQNTRF